VLSSSFRGASAPPGGRRWTGITQATRDCRDAGPHCARCGGSARWSRRSRQPEDVVPKERAIRTGVPTASGEGRRRGRWAAGGRRQCPVFSNLSAAAGRVRTERTGRRRNPGCDGALRCENRPIRPCRVPSLRASGSSILDVRDIRTERVLSVADARTRLDVREPHAQGRGRPRMPTTDGAMRPRTREAPSAGGR
jgi:hypothetical protein